MFLQGIWGHFYLDRSSQNSDNLAEGLFFNYVKKIEKVEIKSAVKIFWIN